MVNIALESTSADPFPFIELGMDIYVVLSADYLDVKNGILSNKRAHIKRFLTFSRETTAI